MMKALALRLEDRNLLTLLKLAEVKLLGRYATTYCYNIPSHVYLELTARCNLRCIWCIQTDDCFRQQYRDDMPFGLFEEIIPKLKGARVLYLTLNGEPLLYPRIYDAIALAKQYIPSVRIITNGTLLEEEASRRMKKAGLSQLGVSIDSTDEDEMFRIRGVSLKKISENVRQFCDITSIPVEIRTVICDDTVGSLKGLPDFARQFSTCSLLYFTLAEGLVSNTSVPMKILGSRKRFLDLKKTVIEKCSRIGFRTNLEYLPYYEPGYETCSRRGRCDALFGRHLAINTKGFIMPCCLYWGNHLERIAFQPFQKAWNGPLTRKWRKRMLACKYTINCSNWCGYSYNDEQS